MGAMVWVLVGVFKSAAAQEMDKAPLDKNKASGSGATQYHDSKPGARWRAARLELWTSASIKFIDGRGDRYSDWFGCHVCDHAKVEGLRQTMDAVLTDEGSKGTRN